MKNVTIIKSCTWCGTTINLLYEQPVRDCAIVKEVKVLSGPLAGQTYHAHETHGCCQRCRETELADIKAQPTAKRCLHGRGPDEWCTDCEATVGNGGGA